MSWHRRANLMALARDVCEQSAEQAFQAMSIEEKIGIEWENTLDVERLFPYYDSPMYVYSCVNCYCDFTRGAAILTAKWLQENPLDTILARGMVLDYGSGIGASSKTMAEMLPDYDVFAHVYGSMHPSSPKPYQARVAEKLLELADNAFVIVTDEMPDEYHIDVACFFEELEHEREPLKVLDAAISHGAQVISHASSFTTENDLGHWPSYIIDGEEVPRKQATRKLNAGLRERGWEHVETGFWNGRPAIWRKT